MTAAYYQFITIYGTGEVVPAAQSLALIFQEAGLAQVTAGDEETDAPFAGHRAPVRDLSPTYQIRILPILNQPSPNIELFYVSITLCPKAIMFHHTTHDLLTYHKSLLSYKNKISYAVK